MTEQAIISGCLLNNPEAQRELYRRYCTKMLSVCCRYAQSREDAEDMLQEGFIRIFTQLHTFKNKGAFEGWIRRIIMHTCINIWKKEKKFYNNVGLNYACYERVNEETIASIMQGKQVEECIGQLPKRYRAVLKLYALEGYSHREIANVLDIEESTSRSQFTRARILLGNILQKKKIWEREEF